MEKSPLLLLRTFCTFTQPSEAHCFTKPMLFSSMKNPNIYLQEFSMLCFVLCPLLGSRTEPFFNESVKYFHQMERSIERTQVFFNKLKEYIDYLGRPSYSKEELKKKKFLAENITR